MHDGQCNRIAQPQSRACFQDDTMEDRMTIVRNPDHVTIAVENAATAIGFFELFGFRKQHVAVIDEGSPARYMGMPDRPRAVLCIYAHWYA